MMERFTYIFIFSISLCSHAAASSSSCTQDVLFVFDRTDTGLEFPQREYAQAVRNFFPTSETSFTNTRIAMASLDKSPEVYMTFDSPFSSEINSFELLLDIILNPPYFGESQIPSGVQKLKLLLESLIADIDNLGIHETNPLTMVWFSTGFGGRTSASFKNSVVQLTKRLLNKVPQLTINCVLMEEGNRVFSPFEEMCNSIVDLKKDEDSNAIYENTIPFQADFDCTITPPPTALHVEAQFDCEKVRIFAFQANSNFLSHQQVHAKAMLDELLSDTEGNLLLAKVGIVVYDSEASWVSMLTDSAATNVNELKSLIDGLEVTDVSGSETDIEQVLDLLEVPTNDSLRSSDVKTAYNIILYGFGDSRNSNSVSRAAQELFRANFIAEYDIEPSQLGFDCVLLKPNRNARRNLLKNSDLCRNRATLLGSESDSNSIQKAQVLSEEAVCPPTPEPTTSPTMSPTFSPTGPTTSSPSFSPTAYPTYSPSNSPTNSPITSSPTYSPSASPTIYPTYSPSNSPTESPLTSSPTFSPSLSPTYTPSNPPSLSPTANPTTESPSSSPTASPVTSEPTLGPTMSPTNNPSQEPSESPSESPSPPPSQSFSITPGSF